jgi:hypothetical protein
LAGSEAPAQTRLNGSSLLVAVAACFVALVSLTEIAGDPTDGVAFYTFALAAALLVGISLVIAASRRPDIFGKLGLAGAIVLLLGSVTIDVLGSLAGAIGVILLIAAMARSAPRLLPGLILLGVGILGLAVLIEASAAPYQTASGCG